MIDIEWLQNAILESKIPGAPISGATVLELIAEVRALREDAERVQTEIVGALTDAGVCMLAENPTAPGEIASAVARLAKDAKRYNYLRHRAELREYGMGHYWHIRTVDVPMGMPAMVATLANAIDAALAKVGA